MMENYYDYTVIIRYIPQVDYDIKINNGNNKLTQIQRNSDDKHVQQCAEK